MNEPQLSKNATLTFLYFHSKIGRQVEQPLSFNERNRLKFQVLLISRRFASSLFDNFDGKVKSSYPLLHVENYHVSIKYWHKNLKFELASVRGFETLIPLLRIAPMPICYIWDQVSLPLNAESLKTWMEVCRALNENQTLRDIRIHFKEHNKNNSFYQLLPDKVKQVKSGPRPACLFVGRKTTMDLYSVEVDNHHSYFNKLFQLKTKKLEFLRDCSWGLWELEDEFIARPNPHLKEIEIHARFSLQRQYIEPELPTWEERYLQKYEKILAQFKILNPNIRLRFHDRETMFDKIPSFDVAYQRIRQLFDNIHEFIDVTVAMDIKVESIYLRNVGVIDLEFPKPQQLALNFNAKLLACRILGKKVGELRNWQDDFTQQMANKLNLYVNERGELVGQWIYKDVVITAREILVFKQTI